MRGKAAKRASGIRLPQELQDKLLEAGRYIRIKERTAGTWRAATATEMVTAGCQALLAMLSLGEEIVDFEVFREAGAVQFFCDGEELILDHGKPVFSRSSPLSRDLYDELVEQFRPVTTEEEILLALDARFIEPGVTAEVRGTLYSGVETTLEDGDFVVVKSISTGRRDLARLTSDRLVERARKAWATTDRGERVHVFDLEVVEDASITEGVEDEAR